MQPNHAQFHLAFGGKFDLEEMNRQAELGQGPRHAMWHIARALPATIHMPDTERNPPSVRDRLLAKIGGSPGGWSQARALARLCSPSDLIYCTDEGSGIPVAAVCGSHRSRPKVVMFFHNLDRPRGRVAARLFGLARRVDMFVTCANTQSEFLKRFLKIFEDRILVMLEHVDTHFFSPGPPLPNKARPLIMGVGLEKRDYKTLAAATHDLQVDVKISGFSRFAKTMARSFPDPLPANMSRRFYSWTELVQLYRDADVVVAPLFPCNYAAGVTILMEGLACCRPVVVTRTDGLADYLTPADGLSLVEPFDAAGLRRAILHLLEHPSEAEAQARSGFELACRKYDFDKSVEHLGQWLKAL